MAYQKILVIGGTGFIGRSIVARLASQNRLVVVATRRRAATKALWPLPMVEVVEANIHDSAELEGLMQGCNAVINLVGILHGRPGRNADPKQLGDGGDPYGPDFSKAQVELPKRIADACMKLGVKRILHMSALGLGDGDKRALPSMYLRSKAAGEQMIKQTACDDEMVGTGCEGVTAAMVDFVERELGVDLPERAKALGLGKFWKAVATPPKVMMCALSLLLSQKNVPDAGSVAHTHTRTHTHTHTHTHTT